MGEESRHSINDSETILEGKKMLTRMQDGALLVLSSGREAARRSIIDDTLNRNCRYTLCQAIRSTPQPIIV